MPRLTLTIFLILAAALTGCAGGKSFDYSVISVNVETEGTNKEIAIGVHDQREYIKNGDKYPQYVGTQRSTAYVPWNINTKSGLPMAEDFMHSIANSMKSKGFEINLVSLSEKESKKQAITHLKETDDKRLLLFTIDKWFFDIFYKIRMSYSMKLEVFDSKGRILAHAEAKKEMWEDNDNAVPAVEFQTTIEFLLNNDKIVKGLDTSLKYSDYDIKTDEVEAIIVKSTPPKVSIDDAVEVLRVNQMQPTTTWKKTPPKAMPNKTIKEKMPCTTDQILKMKDMGMTDSQTKAACK